MAMDEGFGFGLVGRIKNSIEARMKNIKKSVYDTRDTIVKNKPIQPGSIAVNQVQGLRDANRELAPGLKEL